MGENRGGAYNGILQRDRVENFNGMGYQYPPLRSHPTFQPLLRLCPKCFRAVLLSPPPDIGAEYCDDCVCLSVREHNLWNYMPDLSQIFAHVICVCGSVLVWRRCDMLCTSGFTNNVMFNVYIMTRNRQRNRDSVAWIYHRDVYSK